MEDSDHVPLVDEKRQLRRDLVYLLGNTETTLLSEIVNELVKLGVSTTEDLQWVEEDDLSFMKPVQARKLLKNYRAKFAPSRSTSSSSMSSPCLSPTSFAPMSPEPILIHNINRDPNWPITMELPWNDMSSDVSAALISGKRLSPSGKKELVNKTVDAIRKKTERAVRSQMTVIAQRMVAKFPDSLQDKIVDSVVGSGYETLLNKLVGRNENLNRPNASKMCLSRKKRSLESSDLSADDGNNCDGEHGASNANRRDSYGCVKWMPAVSDGELEQLVAIRDELKEEFATHSAKDVDVEKVDKCMSLTYPLQRRDIINGTSMKELKKQWPFLFEVRGLLSHALELLDVDIRAALGNAYSVKAPRLNRFFRGNSVNSKCSVFFEEAARQSKQDNMKAWLMAVVLCIMDYFAEKEKEVFYVADETASVEDLEKMVQTEAPLMVVLGDSVMAGKTYLVMVDRTVITPKIESFIDAFSSFFATYYIFNLEYQIGSASTLEFIQRCFVGINPDRGSKGNKGKKKKASQIGPKVLRLINCLADFEWMDTTI